MPTFFDSLSLIRLHSVPGLGARTLYRLLTWAQGASAALSDLFTWDAQTWSQQTGLKPDLAHAVLATSPDDAAAILEKLDAARVQIVALGDDAYPAQFAARLGEGAPPVLYVLGEAPRLGGVGVAFSGSRRTSEAGVGAARDLAAQAATRGLNVISGHAPGTDLAAHVSAVAAGGVTVLVLPEGILKFRLHADLRAAYEATPDRFVVASEFPPGAPWSTQNAMIRNNTILGLSRALIVTEAGDTGGTLAAGQRALKLGLPCYALDMPGLPSSASGNRLLLNQGARPLRADPAGALRLPDFDSSEPDMPSEDSLKGQLRLF
ncbi:MAG: DNA-protecting protein DprA [Anaerolineae bacterium]|nr:DNA-protecting protein DprA [Anaerolineae bacterium]